MSVIDETWRVRNSVGCTDDVYCDALREYVLRGTHAAGVPGYEVADARAKLAAQAPAMARLLRDLEWTGSLGQGSFGCTLCGVCADWNRDPEHREDCALAAVLRAAGVLE